MTCGVVNALDFIVKTFTLPEDNILVNSPVYNPFYDVIKNNQRLILDSSLSRVDINDFLFTYKIDFNDLEEKIKQSKMYILCNPHNPIGRCYTFDEIKIIVNLCKKYNTILVSDEIHCDIINPLFKFTSVGEFFNEYENIIICTAPSKTFNIAGMGNSNIFFNNKKMFEIFNKRYTQQNIVHNMFGIIATISAYKYGSSWVEKQNIHLDNQANLVYEFVKKYNLKAAKLEATYLMWLDLSRLNLSQEDLLNKLMVKKLWVNDGTKYDQNSIGFIRINIACSEKQLIKGLKLLGELVDSIK